MAFIDLCLRVRPFALAAVTLFVSCSLPDFTFSPSKAEAPAHCRNFRVDASESGIDCGGSECPKCGLGQTCTQPSDCENGQCVEKLCQAASCTNKQKDPDESDLDCGGSRCAPCPDAGACKRASDCGSKNCSTAGVCVAATCEDDIQNGNEIALDCGGTCPGCPAATPCAEDENCASLECQAGACTAPCSGSLRECDGDPKTTCETNTKTDPNHCGACNQRCQLDHANAACSGGECQIAECKPPWDDCDGKLENGCETNLNEDPQRCGKCEVTCSNLNGTAKCVAGACDITCNDGASNCDANSPGCESQTQTDVKNCGGCNRVCAARPGYTAFCAAGQCGETMCPDNFGNCNGVQGDQCEANLLEDPLNCGACGSKCVVEHGTAGCENGQCIVLGCDAGFGNCDVASADGGYATGCETNTRTSLEHCGACQRACAIEHGTSQCEGGACKVKSCSAPYQDCDDEGLSCSVNTHTDDKNCGGCGESGSDCTTLYPNGSGKCMDGSCQLVSCKQNFDSCDNNPASGCETNLLQDEAHCGQCKRACQTTNADSSTCNAGVCAPTCNNPAFGACINPALGCVDSLDTRERCGSCTKSCSGATPFCVNRVCADRMPIRVESSGTQATASNATANMMYTIAKATGQYRLLLLAVATGSHLGRGQLQSAPTLSYGSTTTPFIALENNSLTPNGATPVWVKHFYLLDAALPPQATAVSVRLTMNNGTPQDPTMLIANLLELTGVDQTTPFAQTPVAISTSGGNSCVAPNPKTVEISSALSGAFLYSLSAGEWWHTAFNDARSTQTLNVTLSSDRLRAVGGYQGPVTTTSTTIGWGNSSGPNGNCNNAVHQIVVIRPALTP